MQVLRILWDPDIEASVRKNSLCKYISILDRHPLAAPASVKAGEAGLLSIPGDLELSVCRRISGIEIGRSCHTHIDGYLPKLSL